MAALTPTGASQHLRLGAKLRKRYLGSVLPDQYSPLAVNLVSSTSSRTRLCAAYQLFGLYPQLITDFFGISPLSEQSELMLKVVSLKDWPFPVNNLLVKAYKYHPSRAAFEQETRECEAYKLREAAWQRSLFPTVSRALHYPVKSIKSAADISSALDCEVAEGHPLPPGISQQLHWELKKVHGFEKFTVSFRKREACVAAVSALLADISSVFASDTLRFKLYSAHDTTLAALLMYFGVQMEVVPGFASAILLEKSEKGVISCTFDDLPCSGKYVRFPCTVKEFAEQVHTAALAE